MRSSTKRHPSDIWLEVWMGVSADLLDGGANDRCLCQLGPTVANRVPVCQRAIFPRLGTSRFIPRTAVAPFVDLRAASAVAQECAYDLLAAVPV